MGQEKSQFEKAFYVLFLIWALMNPPWKSLIRRTTNLIKYVYFIPVFVYFVAYTRTLFNEKDFYRYPFAGHAIGSQDVCAGFFK